MTCSRDIKSLDIKFFLRTISVFYYGRTILLIGAHHIRWLYKLQAEANYFMLHISIYLLLNSYKHVQINSILFYSILYVSKRIEK